MKQAVIFVCAFAVLFQAYADNSSPDTVTRVDVSRIIDLVNELKLSLEEVRDIFDAEFTKRVAAVQSDAANGNDETVTKIVNIYKDYYHATTAKADAAGSSKMTATEFVKLIRIAADSVIDRISELVLTGEENSIAVKTEDTFEQGLTGVEETLDQMGPGSVKET